MKTTIEVMVDLETLGTAPGSIVLSVGAAAGSLDRGLVIPSPGFLSQISVLDSFRLGLTSDPATQAWWRQQSREAWDKATGGDDVCSSNEETCEAFAAWLESLRSAGDGSSGSAIRIWGDGATFDPVLLECVFKAAGVRVPWTYTEVHCYRTVRQVLGSKKPRSKLQHYALSDAEAQLEHLLKLLPLIEGIGQDL